MSRLETGPYRPDPKDWQGVFIRGDEALHYASMLRFVKDNDVKDFPIAEAVVDGLIKLLESCYE